MKLNRCLLACGMVVRGQGIDSGGKKDVRVERIAPQPLKAEGNKFLGIAVMGRLQKEVEKRLAG